MEHPALVADEFTDSNFADYSVIEVESCRACFRTAVDMVSIVANSPDGCFSKLRNYSPRLEYQGTVLPNFDRSGCAAFLKEYFDMSPFVWDHRQWILLSPVCLRMLIREGIRLMLRAQPELHCLLRFVEIEIQLNDRLTAGFIV